MGKLLSQDVCDRIKRLRSVHDKKTVAAILKIDVGTVREVERRGFKAGSSGRLPRPIPWDFAKRAAEMTRDQLADHYGETPGMISRWNVRIGRKTMRGNKPTPMPSREEILAAIAKFGCTKGAEHFGVSPDTFVTWRKKHGLRIRGQKRLAPTPEERIGWVERYVAEQRARA